MRLNLRRCVHAVLRSETAKTIVASKWTTVRCSKTWSVTGMPTGGSTEADGGGAGQTGTNPGPILVMQRIVRPERASGGSAVPSAAVRSNSYCSAEYGTASRSHARPPPVTPFFLHRARARDLLGGPAARGISRSVLLT